MSAARRREEYPTLSQLLRELETLERAGVLEGGANRIQGGGRFQFRRGRDLGRLTWPGVGDFRLDRPQQEVVAALIDAYLNCRSPEVGERYLLAAARTDCRRLADVFEGSEAWGRLVVPGRLAGTYRVAEPRGDAVRDVDSVEDDEGFAGE